MNYYDKVDEIVGTITSPCDDAVGPGEYRRVKWELYNPTGAYIQPGNGEEWDTEIIPQATHLYTRNPFGNKSTPFPTPPPPEDGSSQGLFCAKLGIFFISQVDLENYVASIGATLLAGNDWYGADLSKSALYKTSIEKDMYTIENCGGIWTPQGPQMDARTMIAVTADYHMYVNFNGLGNSRRAYLKYYDTKPCTYVGLVLNLDVDMSLPGVPVPGPVSIGPLPPELPGRARAISCIPFSAQFPYNGLTNAIIESWNTSRSSFKLYWDMLPGWPSGGGTDLEKFFDSAYSKLSVAMEELSSSAVAMCQYVQQMAFLAFKDAISQVLNIVGGGWDLLKSFLPTITIMGVTIDLEELCTSGDGVQKLKEAWENFDIEEVITSVYAAMGSAYEYSVERVKMYSRDLVTAAVDFYNWAWTQLLMAGVALSKLCVDLAQIWSMPPVVPNPVWSVITAVKEMMKQVKPLDMIMSGNFPGFTATDIYQQVMEKVDVLIDAAYAKIQDYKTQALALWDQIKQAKSDLQKQAIEFKQYLSGMWEKVTDELTAQKEAALAQAEAALELLKNKYKQLQDFINSEQMSVSDVLDLALEEFKKLPIVAQAEELLGLLGGTIDEMMTVYTNAVTQAKSLYHEYTDGSSSIKDLCKSLYNQISTLSLSKVVQWINKMLGIFGLTIAFPAISICIPCLESPTR